MTNKKHGTLYTGMTNNLIRRIYEHKNHIVDGFTRKYSIDMLVYYEQFHDVNEAILREKQIKKWNRAWKIDLIEKMNPSWSSLYESLLP